MNIATFLYKLNKLGFYLWLEGNKLKYKQYKECNEENTILNEIKSNKDDIIEFLKINECYSPVLPYEPYIYKSNNRKSPLSFAQERLWFIDRYEGGSNVYNIPMIFKLSNSVKLDILETSIKSIVSRHEILRSLIKEDDKGNSYQLVMSAQEYSFDLISIDVLDKFQLDREIEKQVNHFYDLSNEYPIRACIYKLLSTSSEHYSEYYLSIVVHHIAFDGWSVNIFLEELEVFYNHYLQHGCDIDTYLTLPKLEVQYKDFALWQRSYLNGEICDKQLKYWKNKLSNYETLDLITAKPRPRQVSYKGKDIYFELGENLSNSLRKLAKDLEVSLYSLLLSGYYLMLRVYSGKDDIVIGTPVSNRHYSKVEDLIGFFVNSLVLRNKINPKDLIIDFIRSVGNDVKEAQLNQDLPFEKLVEELKIPKDTSRNPIFQVMFGVQSFGEMLNNKEVRDKLLQIYKPSENIYEIARFDITTLIDSSLPCLNGVFNYSVDLYNETTIKSFIRTYKKILDQLADLNENRVEQNQVRVSDIVYLSQEDDQVIYKWNKDNNKDYSRDETMILLFEEQVEKTPEAIAVTCGDIQLTYKVLNEKVNKLSHYLIKVHSIKPDSLVGVYLDKSEHMLVAILAVLKAGGAYVPIDLSYPDSRISYILQDTKTKLVLTNKIYQ
jgi:hypothetical protein